MKKIKYSVLTFIFGNYECLHEILDVQPDIEYICITDNKNLKSNTWKIVYDEINPIYTSFRKVIEVRYNPFKYVHSDICLIIDGSIQILKIPYKLLDYFKNNNYDLCALSHPDRNKLIDELNIWKTHRNLSDIDYNTCKTLLLNIDYDLNYKGLYQVGILLVSNNNKYNLFRNKCLSVINNCTFKNSAFRIDQILFTVVLHKWFANNFNFMILSEKELRCNYFRYYYHNSSYYQLYKEINLFKPEIKYAFNKKTISKYIDNLEYIDKNITINNSLTIGICNFNTTKLTNACIGSIIKHIKKYKYNIIILDNSDNCKFELDNKYKNFNIKIIDNTTNKYIDFNKIISLHGGNTINNYANLKHTISIQFLIDICINDYFVLFDSDILLKKDIDFINDDIITCADIQHEYLTNVDTKKYIMRFKRFIPFIQFFNVKLMKQYQLKYLDFYKIVGTYYKNSVQYDTGSSFYLDVINKHIQFKQINHNDYIEHLLGSSWAKIHNEKDFLEKYKHLYT